MAIAAGSESFFTSAGPNVTSDLGVPMFTDMEMPESVGGKRMRAFEANESLVHRYDDELAFQLLKRNSQMPFNRVKSSMNSPSVRHDMLIEDLAELGSVNFKKASEVVKRINMQEQVAKPWVLLGGI
jgi:hypothetical protein